MSNAQAPKPVHRGVYILPNLFTVSAMFAGFYAIIASTKGLFDNAAIAIFVGIVLDTLDGRIARLTHSQSDFGAQMDSLSDMVCFAVAPSLVLYFWCLSSLGKPGWLVAFLYAVGTALRLARFNATAQSENKRYFQGLATPAAAGLVASIVWSSFGFGISGVQVAWPMLIITILLALLKVSSIQYRSFKDFDIRNKVPFMSVLLIVLVVVLISFNPPVVILLILTAYIVSGPIGFLWKMRPKPAKKTATKKTKR